MKRVIFFLFLFLALIGWLAYCDLAGLLPPPIQKIHLLFRCILAGGAGGSVYCLRAVYLNACVRKQWDLDWQPWYYIRPFVSMVCGGVSYLFLKAGILVLESTQKTDRTDLGFLALALVAGLNVDKFITKIEDIAQAVWGIEKSRTAKETGIPTQIAAKE